MQDSADPQLARHGAGMLAGRAAERDQDVIAGITALGHGNRADGLSHACIGHAHQTVGQLERLEMTARFAGDLVAQGRQTLFGGPTVQRKRETVRQDFAQQEIHVGNGQRSAATIAGRTRPALAAIGSDNELYAVEAADRTAASSHGFDGHHRSDNADARLFGLEFQFVAPVESRDVGTGSAHVKTNGMIETSRASHARKADHSAGGTRKNAVLADKTVRVD